MMETDLYQMLDFIEQRLQPAMAGYDYHNPVTPLDLTLGLSGCPLQFRETVPGRFQKKWMSICSV